VKSPDSNLPYVKLLIENHRSVFVITIKPIFKIHNFLPYQINFCVTDTTGLSTGTIKKGQSEDVFKYQLMNKDLDLQVALFGLEGVISLDKIREASPQEIDFKLTDQRD
jgi:hypothetical protein